MNVNERFQPTLYETFKVFLYGTVHIVQERGESLYKIFFSDGDKKLTFTEDGKVQEHEYLSNSSKTLNKEEINSLINKLKLCLKE